MDLPHHNPSSRQGLHENCVPDDKIFSSICSDAQTPKPLDKERNTHFLCTSWHCLVISSLFFYSLHVYRRPTCVCDEHVCSRIMIAVAGDMIMIAALLLHNNNLGRGVVVWCTGHAAVHACQHQLSRARGCTRGCCYYATSVRGGPHNRKIPGLHVLQVLINWPSPTTSPVIHTFP